MLLALVAIAASVAAPVLGVGSGLDGDLRNVRDGWRERPASGQVVIVEIDAASIAALRQWPWPRSTHATLIERLHKAGAAQILFDVDFSAQSTPEGDAALASALATADGTVVLPTFRQAAAWNQTGVIENLPIEPLRKNAILASVNIVPDRDGVVRRYAYGTQTGGMARPSLAAMIAGVPGHIGRDFTIDQAIDAHSIPRVSYIELLNSDRALSRIRGKQAIIGATAIEMGDRYAVPRQGILPGVVVQALAAETLIQGGPVSEWGPWPAWIATALAMMALARTSSHNLRRLGEAGWAMALILIPLATEAWAGVSIGVVPALLLTVACAAMAFALDVFGALRRARLLDRATGLPNRAALLEGTRKSKAGTTFVAARLDLLSDLNMVLDPGHQASLLRQAAHRIAAGNGGAVVHLAGDGILAWASSIPAGDDLEAVLEGLGALFQSPFIEGTRAIPIKLAFGVMEGAGRDKEKLLLGAIQASRIAADRGKIWLCNDQALLDQSSLRLRLLSDLDNAMASGQFSIVYQPKLRLRDRDFNSAEALLRWTHPELGAVSPAEFIPLFESEGRMRALTLHVLREVMDELHDHGCGPGSRRVNVAVNISGTLLSDAEFLAALLELLATHPQEAHCLTAEVTESAAIDDAETAIWALTRIAHCGVRISIDDYGTGQSTLSYLKRFPAQEIKIDQSFTRDIVANRHDQILVRSTIELAHQLGFDVVAEGIETEMALSVVESFGCDYVQGWHIGRPMASAEFFSALRAAA